MASGPGCGPPGGSGSSAGGGRRVASVSPSDVSGPRVDRRFRRPDRVRLHREYDRVYQKGRRAAGRFVLLYAVPNGLDRTRLGITAGRRVGGAVRRNRLKRWVRETFRLHRAEFPPGCDVVVQVRPEASNAAHDALASDIRAAAGRLDPQGARG